MQYKNDLTYFAVFGIFSNEWLPETVVGVVKKTSTIGCFQLRDEF